MIYPLLIFIVKAATNTLFLQTNTLSKRNGEMIIKIDRCLNSVILKTFKPSLERRSHSFLTKPLPPILIMNAIARISPLEQSSKQVWKSADVLPRF